MTEILFLKLLHILLFVYWLGGDLGVFYSSKYIADASRGVEARRTAADIMLFVDQAPRICMALMLPTGFHLCWKLGLVPMSGISVAGLWVFGLLWVATVIKLHISHGQAVILTKVDWWGRLIVITGLLALSIHSLVGDGLLRADWVAWKLIVFAGLMTMGLLIRINLKPFGPAFGKLVTVGADDEVNATIKASLAKVKPFVVTIWVGLLVNAMLGLHIIGV
ncbi:MAG: hypothetical protein AB8B96_16475 [Lysobacterales bacterium]